MIFKTGRHRGWLVVATATALGASACGSTDSAESSDSEKLQVVTAFYPLQYATERIAGDRAEVTDLTKPGAEPHDLELGPRDVGTVVQADLAVYLEGFQPSVDDAVAEGDNGFEVGRFADLKAPSELGGGGHEDHDHHDHGDSDDQGNEGDEGHDHDRQSTDSHFWLDPQRYADIAPKIADRLGQADPDNAEAYDKAAADLVSDLRKLDKDLKQGLADCRNRDLVVSHEAFGYLADRYDFTQYGISGLDPHAEPSPRKIAELAELTREHDVSTIYHETLVSDDTARTIAKEADVDVDVLDPVEGLTDSSEGNDYLQVMRSNLETLRQGQDCSS